jgi:hypothetical protein
MPLPLIPIALALAQFAPSVLRFFGAGAASTAVAEQVAGIAQSVTGATTPEAALAMLRENASLAQQFNLAVLQQDGELEQAYLADRQNARQRDVDVRRLTGGTNVRADVMIVGVVLGLLACLGTLILFRKDIPGEVVGIISTVAGIFGACLRDAFQFEFGSSRGSKDKDELLAQMQAAAVPK